MTSCPIYLQPYNSSKLYILLFWELSRHVVDTQLRTIDKELEKKYNIDERILNLERIAEQNYLQNKMNLNRQLEEKQRERSVKDSLYFLRQEKERLQESLRLLEQAANNVPQDPYAAKNLSYKPNEDFPALNPNLKNSGLSLTGVQVNSVCNCLRIRIWKSP